MEEQVFLQGTIRERLQDLMKSSKITQAELATRIGCSDSLLSRFLNGVTDKLGDENIIRIARVFNVSTDFLLGETDLPDKLHYDISELGLSVQAARNLYTQKVNPQVVSALLENPEFVNTTYLIDSYLNDELARGMAPRINFARRLPILSEGRRKSPIRSRTFRHLSIRRTIPPSRIRSCER